MLVLSLSFPIRVTTNDNPPIKILAGNIHINKVKDEQKKFADKHNIKLQ